MSVTAQLIPVQTKLSLRGPCPAKKNLWRSNGKGAMFLDATIKAQIDSLTIQARSQWHRPPVESPEMEFTFFVAAARRDRDGMLTTVLDCLQDAGVLLNDNIAHNNGRTVLHPCRFVSAGKERVDVEIQA
jgi:Holliday junction resolvase RusA-like endonuclease